MEVPCTSPPQHKKESVLYCYPSSQTRSSPVTASSTTSSYIDAHSAIDYIEDDTSAMGRHGRSASSSAVGTLHPYALSKGCTSPNDSSNSINKRALQTDPQRPTTKALAAAAKAAATTTAASSAKEPCS